MTSSDQRLALELLVLGFEGFELGAEGVHGTHAGGLALLGRGLGRLLRHLVLADLLDGRLLLVERAFGRAERRLRRAADLLLRGFAVELGDGLRAPRGALRRRWRLALAALLRHEHAELRRLEHLDASAPRRDELRARLVLRGQLAVDD
ncbi:unnamed protein product [Pelagomonas calceolata]|uniref:Uncharacterized protein n=1 Tax=Pelagomonas calceolata TaxID=35677 RepID=A0A8J2S4C2_9STRA|nr:unnamed protein product [Pelagomonas calceolata]